MRVLTVAMPVLAALAFLPEPVLVLNSAEFSAEQSKTLERLLSAVPASSSLEEAC